MSRNNALASGGRAKGALRPNGIVKGISPQYDYPDLRGRRGKLEERPARRDLRQGAKRAESKELIGDS